MTSQISEQSVETIKGFLKGRRLEKLLTSIEILRAAEARGSFESRESVKALAGINPGLLTRQRVDNGLHGDFQDSSTRHRAKMCLQHGLPYQSSNVRFSVEGVPQEIIDAWVQLCREAHSLHTALKAARPKPVITAIGLSPKVTTTLTEMNLDIDLPTITPAEIEEYKLQAHDPKTGEPRFAKDGSPLMETHYRVKWSQGIKLGKSRFFSGCQACGKPIPSGRYVPIEATCRKNGRIGLWLGCDCAKNVFGVKDLGIAKD